MTRVKLCILISGTLTIERSQEQDIGKYECVAENEIGVAYSFAAMLYVKSKYFQHENVEYRDHTCFFMH